MGYYTTFTLNLSNAKAEWYERLEDEIAKMNVFEGGSIWGGYFASSKWYDAERDMLLLSARFPDVLFELEGDGEDSDDHWLHYYKGGRAMHNGIEVVRHEFDETLLDGEPIQDMGQRYSDER